MIGLAELYLLCPCSKCGRMRLPGDSMRFQNQMSNEQHIHSLLLSHERQGKHSGRPHIPLNDEMRAIQTINHRLSMLVELARFEDPDVELTAEELQAHTRKIAIRYSALCSAYESALAAYKRNPDNVELQKALASSHMEYELSEAEGWDWATSASIAAYTGGSFGDEGAAVQLPGLIEWRSMADGGPIAIEYVSIYQSALLEIQISKAVAPLKEELQAFRTLFCELVQIKAQAATREGAPIAAPRLLHGSFDPTERRLSANELARELRVTVDTVNNWICKNQIRTCVMGGLLLCVVTDSVINSLRPARPTRPNCCGKPVKGRVCSKIPGHAGNCGLTPFG